MGGARILVGRTARLDDRTSAFAAELGQRLARGCRSACSLDRRQHDLVCRRDAVDSRSRACARLPRGRVRGAPDRAHGRDPAPARRRPRRSDGDLGIRARALVSSPSGSGAFDPISGYRLAEPVGYWNVLGLLAAMGALLALGFVRARNDCRGRRLQALRSSCSSRPSTSRSAAVPGSRSQRALSSPSFAIRGGCSSLFSALVTARTSGGRRRARFACGRFTHLGAPLDDASREGHDLALALAVFAVLNADHRGGIRLQWRHAS